MKPWNLSNKVIGYIPHKKYGHCVKNGRKLGCWFEDYERTISRRTMKQIFKKKLNNDKEF